MYFDCVVCTQRILLCIVITHKVGWKQGVCFMCYKKKISSSMPTTYCVVLFMCCYNRTLGVFSSEPGHRVACNLGLSNKQRRDKIKYCLFGTSRSMSLHTTYKFPMSWRAERANSCRIYQACVKTPSWKFENNI